MFDHLSTCICQIQEQPGPRNARYIMLKVQWMEVIHKAAIVPAALFCLAHNNKDGMYMAHLSIDALGLPATQDSKQLKHLDTF